MAKIDYKKILGEIKPTEAEKEKVVSLSNHLINIINQTAMNEGINAEAVLVGSVAKGTWLSGKADIDIFIKFPLNTSPDDLKEKGLHLGYECIKKMHGKYELRYASHPYVTGLIEGYEVDFVPCYHIKRSEELKSAVDRTIPHTKYIQEHLMLEQRDEVMLLKRFMECVGTYGSEFKVGGFAGYLCELLVLEYGTFEQVLGAASKQWKPGHQIDLAEYGTASLFNEPLVVVDPVDGKRNVAAALSLQRMSEFVVASRNYLEEPSIFYFYPKEILFSLKDLREEFKRRGTKTLLLSFKTPEIPIDALYPQIKKTEKSMVALAQRNEFEVFGSDSWTDEKEKVIILLEFDIWSLPRIKKHNGPQLWIKDHEKKFLDKYEDEAWLEDDRWVTALVREHSEAESLLEASLSDRKIGLLKFGKHIKGEILKEHKLFDLNEFLASDKCGNDVLIFLNSYLNKSEILWR